MEEDLPAPISQNTQSLYKSGSRCQSDGMDF